MERLNKIIQILIIYPQLTPQMMFKRHHEPIHQIQRHPLLAHNHPDLLTPPHLEPFATGFRGGFGVGAGGKAEGDVEPDEAGEGAGVAHYVGPGGTAGPVAVVAAGWGLGVSKGMMRNGEKRGRERKKSWTITSALDERLLHTRKEQASWQPIDQPLR